MPTTAPRYKQQGARAPGPKPPGCAQARTRGGRLAWVLGRNAKGWIAVELDGNANEEGKAYERKSLRWAQFAPGQDSILAAAPPDAPKAPEPPPPPPRARRQPKPTQRTPYEEPIDPHNTEDLALSDDDDFYQKWLRETLDSGSDPGGSHDGDKDDDFRAGDMSDDDSAEDTNNDESALSLHTSDLVPRTELQLLLKDAATARESEATAPLATTAQLSRYQSDLGGDKRAMGALTEVVRRQLSRHLELLVETLARSANTENGDTSVSGPHGRSASLLLALGAAARSHRREADARCAIRAVMEDASGGGTRLTRLGAQQAQGSSILDRVRGLDRVDEVLERVSEGLDARRVLEAVGVSIHSLPPQAQRGAPLSFTAGEDALLLRGLQLYGDDAFDDVRKHLLPAKTRELLVFRVASLTRQGANDISRFRERRSRRGVVSKKWSGYDDKILALGAVVHEIGTAARVNWEEVAPLLPHRAAGELRKRWAKISSKWLDELKDMKRAGVDLLKELQDAKRVRDKVALVAQVRGRVVETPALWYPDGGVRTIVDASHTAQSSNYSSVSSPQRPESDATRAALAFAEPSQRPQSENTMAALAFASSMPAQPPKRRRAPLPPVEEDSSAGDSDADEAGLEAARQLARGLPSDFAPVGEAEFSLIGRQELGDLASLHGLPSQGFEEPPKKPARKRAKKKKKPAAAPPAGSFFGAVMREASHG
jgi:hypothetical protein